MIRYLNVVKAMLLIKNQTLEGLYLKNFDFTKIKVNKNVKEYYNNLEKLIVQ